MTRAWWAALAAVGLLWPARVVGSLDGMPLDSPAEAVVIGLVVPALWLLDGRAFTRRGVRFAILALVGWKLVMALAVGQQGWCAATVAPGPLDGINQGIPIIEPHGALRSWDVRADWRHPQPTCTAIVTRGLPERHAFPAWFLNVTAPFAGMDEVRMSVRGYVTTRSPGDLGIQTALGNRLEGVVDGQAVGPGPVALNAGVHRVDLSMTLVGDDWRFEPLLNGQSLFTQALVTTDPPGALDRAVAPWAGWVTPLLVLWLVGGLMWRVVTSLRTDVAVWVWVLAASAAAVAVGLRPESPLVRVGGLIGLGAVVLPVRSALRGLRGAFLLVGIPWLAFIAAWSLPKVGHFTLYSYDDWLTYQVAAHRIYMQGYWLEGGNAVFDFQPFYRWMTGALHLLFGDSSVGEVYWDAACLLMGALLAFRITRSAVGFRWGVAAAAGTLGTLTLATPWYFLGRGLSEIAAAGWAFLAIDALMRSRRGRLAWAGAAALMAALMFYTRLNHLLFAAFLPAVLLPLRTSFRWDGLARAAARVPRGPAAVFVGGFGLAVILFMTRTWYYTGVLSLFHGTSLRHNDTGLRPWTLLDGEVWGKVTHSLAATVFMNEPPHLDPRSLLMVVGAIVALAALVRPALFRRMPAALLVVTVGGTVGAFLAHAHGYPGRFSIHLVPFASSLTMIGAAAVMGAFTRARGVPVPATS